LVRLCTIATEAAASVAVFDSGIPADGIKHSRTSSQ